MSVQRRSSRAALQPAARQLSEQDIVDAALRLIRKDGAEKLTMRTLAAELGVTAMAIYYHVPNKEALLDLVVDSVLSRVPMPAPSAERWQAQMKAYILASRELTSAYPGLSRVIVERGDSEAVRALVRYGISLLLAAGFDPREAALAITTYNTYLFGVYAAMAAQPAQRVSRRRPLRRAPSTVAETGLDAVVRHLRELSLEDSLDYGVDAVIDGIAARAKRKRPRKT
jgi:TetR/AcrR family transcriptional regulator, tetracycline repressor protein